MEVCTKYSYIMLIKLLDYGLTEAGIIISVPYEEGGQRVRKPGSVGVPLPSVSIKVFNRLGATTIAG